MKPLRLFLRLVCAGSGHPTFTTTAVVNETVKDGDSYVVNPYLVATEKCFCGKKSRSYRIE